jgi:Ras family
MVRVTNSTAHKCGNTSLISRPDNVEGRDLAKHFGCRFIETSAKQRINVDEAFSNLVREIRKYNKVRSVYADRLGIGVLTAPDV